jgi:iron complex outermembrane recepter protein
MRKIFLLISFLFSTYLLMAQQTYTVTVTDAKTGNAVTNASVIVKATKKGATANADGVFTIQASINDVLEITGIGYQSKMVKITSITNINVSLQASAIELADVVVVGSRGGARVKTETAVPVDVIKINQVGLPTAKMDLTSILNMAAPSFNYNKQSGADGADHLDLGTLRGLGPDQTLILINGKRRHQTAFVALFGTRGRGASGTDLNAFPQSAVDRIEILRDGASAQYGSDAMAGVMNIQLKKDVNHWTINKGWGGYYDTRFNSLKSVDPTQYYTGSKIDGGTYNLSVNNGFKVGKSGGFVNISFDYLNQGKTFRQVPDTNAATNTKALPYYNGGRRAFGDGSVNTAGAMYNMELPIQSTNTIFYSFGGYNQKKSDAFAYTRNLSAKPERFPVDAAGNSIIVPSIMRTSSDGGTYYNPHIGTTIKDLSLALGIKGITNNLWNWDLSFTGGNNNFQYFGNETFNSSLIGNITKTSFDDGGFKFSQATVNADMSKSFKNEGINFAYGVEYRREVYSIYAGEEASYKNYTPTPTRYRILDGTGDSIRVPAAGAQGFPGFSPADVVKASRNVFGAYADAEFNFTTAWLADAAVRFENYSDFGSVATFKLATRYKVSDKFNLRGSASTGFRAPSLQQINFSNTLTSFSAGQLVQSRIANNNDPITKLAGIPKLTQEKSTSLSLGFSSKPAKGLTFTIDGYVTKIKDRVVLSGLFSADDATLPVALTNALKAINVSTAQFFSNAINTTNYGVDIVLDYSTKIGKGNFKGLLAGNIQNISIDAIKIPAALNTNTLNRKTFFSDREEAFVKASAPKSKFAISLEYAVNKVGFGTHFTYFGKVQLKGFGDATPDNPNYAGINPMVPSDANGTYVPENFNYNGKLVTDIFVRYKFCKAVALFIGSDNVFNIHPNLGVVPAARGWAGDNESGGPWDSVQMGFNGRKLFAKLAFNF